MDFLWEQWIESCMLSAIRVASLDIIVVVAPCATVIAHMNAFEMSNPNIIDPCLSFCWLSAFGGRQRSLHPVDPTTFIVLQKPNFSTFCIIYDFLMLAHKERAQEFDAYRL